MIWYIRILSLLLYSITLHEYLMLYSLSYWCWQNIFIILYTNQRSYYTNSLWLSWQVRSLSSSSNRNGSAVSSPETRGLEWALVSALALSAVSLLCFCFPHLQNGGFQYEYPWFGPYMFPKSLHAKGLVPACAVVRISSTAMLSHRSVTWQETGPSARWPWIESSWHS